MSRLAMVCMVCGYRNKAINFIELNGMETGPYVTECERLSGGRLVESRRGTPITLYACPECGTVRIEI